MKKIHVVCIYCRDQDLIDQGGAYVAKCKNCDKRGLTLAAEYDMASHISDFLSEYPNHTHNKNIEKLRGALEQWKKEHE